MRRLPLRAFLFPRKSPWRRSHGNRNQRNSRKYSLPDLLPRNPPLPFPINNSKPLLLDRSCYRQTAQVSKAPIERDPRPANSRNSSAGENPRKKKQRNAYLEYPRQFHLLPPLLSSNLLSSLLQLRNPSPPRQSPRRPSTGKKTLTAHTGRKTYQRP